MKRRTVPGSDGAPTVTSDEDVQIPTDEECLSQTDAYAALTDHDPDNADQSSNPSDEVTYILSQIVRSDPKPKFTLAPVPVKVKKSTALYQPVMSSMAQASVQTVPATPGPHDEDSGYPRLKDSAAANSDEMAKLFENLSNPPSPVAARSTIELQTFTTIEHPRDTSKDISAAFNDKNSSSTMPYVENFDNVENVLESDSPYTENQKQTESHLISQCTISTDENFTPETLPSTSSDESCSVYKGGYISEEAAKKIGSSGGGGAAIQDSTPNHLSSPNPPTSDSLSTSEFGVYVSCNPAGQPHMCMTMMGTENEAKFVTTSTQNDNSQLLHSQNKDTTTMESQHGSSVDSDCINFDDSPVIV